MRIVRLTRQYAGPGFDAGTGDKVQPRCAECGRIHPLVLGLEADHSHRRIALCPYCARDWATELLSALGLPFDAGRVLMLLEAVPKSRPVQTVAVKDGLL